MLLTVPSAVSDKFRQSSTTSRLSPSRRSRAQELANERRQRITDDDDDNHASPRHHHVPSLYRGSLQAAAASTDWKPQLSTSHEWSTAAKRSRRLPVPVDGPPPSTSSPRRAVRQTGSIFQRAAATAAASRDHRRYDQCRPEVQMDIDDLGAECYDNEVDIVSTAGKPILANYRCHDCSMENVRTFVNGMEQGHGNNNANRRLGCGKPVVSDFDEVDSPSRKSVRFASVVRVCDPASMITFCQLRHQSASSAPAAIGGGSSSSYSSSTSLPKLSSGGCVGTGSTSVGQDDELPGVVERYMVRRGQPQRHCVDDMDSPARSTSHLRLPPLRPRRV